jgi:hypothetical protein
MFNNINIRQKPRPKPAKGEEEETKSTLQSQSVSTMLVFTYDSRSNLQRTRRPRARFPGKRSRRKCSLRSVRATGEMPLTQALIVTAPRVETATRSLKTSRWVLRGASTQRKARRSPTTRPAGPNSRNNNPTIVLRVPALLATRVPAILATRVPALLATRVPAILATRVPAILATRVPALLATRVPALLANLAPYKARSFSQCPEKPRLGLMSKPRKKYASYSCRRTIRLPSSKGTKTKKINVWAR